MVDEAAGYYLPATIAQLPGLVQLTHARVHDIPGRIAVSPVIKTILVERREWPFIVDSGKGVQFFAVTPAIPPEELAPEQFEQYPLSGFVGAVNLFIVGKTMDDLHG